MPDAWNWKGKDGSRNGLLYESGNWGDLLKMLWLGAVLDWKHPVAYFDPFAGDVEYPLSEKIRFRIKELRTDFFAFLRRPFLDRGVWPSAAAAAREMLAQGTVEVWDKDEGRRANWRNRARVAVPQKTRGERGEIESGWHLLRDHADDPDAVWLLDPYDFLAEWRDWLEIVADKSRRNTTLLYVYNRSAKSPEAFREYRACRNALDDLRGGLPKRVGRAASDVFLPRAHHEMWYLPSEKDAGKPGLDDHFELLSRMAGVLEEGMRRAGLCEA